jgi:glycosyltransferase involved in cell wall biosynthesis
MQSQKKPVILQILPALQSGGVERGTIDIALALKENGFTPLVASNGGILTHQLAKAQIMHLTLPVHSKNPITIYKNNQKLIKLIKEYQIDLIHVRSRAPMWSAYFACKKTKTKLVATVHGTYSLKFLKFKNFFLKRIYNQIMLKADAIIAVSGFIKNYIAQNYKIYDAKKITIINRGADLNYFNINNISSKRIENLVNEFDISENKKIILMPARFTSWKGHEFLIDALSKVNEEFLCIMIGSDHGHEKYRKKLEEKIINNNLAAKIKITGLCKDMPAAYALSDFVVFPSIRPEAFGRIAIEAQACQKAVIATNIGGALDTIIDEKTGFFVAPFDVENFANLISKLLKMSKEELDEIGANGRKNIEENFSNNQMCERTINLYKEVLFG